MSVEDLENVIFVEDLGHVPDVREMDVLIVTAQAIAQSVGELGTVKSVWDVVAGSTTCKGAQCPT